MVYRLTVERVAEALFNKLDRHMENYFPEKWDKVNILDKEIWLESAEIVLNIINTNKHTKDNECIVSKYGPCLKCGYPCYEGEPHECEYRPTQNSENARTVLSNEISRLEEKYAINNALRARDESSKTREDK